MLNAALRLNIPTIFVSGGPMEAGKAVVVDGVAHAPTDLITAITASANDEVSDEGLTQVEASACPTCGSCSGMFTANSMNCLTEALGLALPGNGTTLATHTARRGLFEKAGSTIVDMCRRYYGEEDESVLPRNIASKEAFTNAMALDMAMGGSTNTILHTLAAAQEGEVDFTLDDINDISYRVPCLSKVAPNGTYHIEDVHRAGGIPAILGELRRAGHLNLKVHTALYDNAEQWLDDWDIRNPHATEEARELYYAAPGGVRTTEPFSQSNRWDELDNDAANGCIHDAEHAFFPTVASLYCAATSLPTGPSSRQQASKRSCGPSPALHESWNLRRKRYLSSSIRRFSRAMSWSSAMKARPVALACRRCSTRLPSSRAPVWERHAP